MLARRNNGGLTNIDKWVEDFFNEPFGGLFGSSAIDKQEPWSILNQDFSMMNIARHPVRSTKLEDGTLQYQFDVPGLDKEDLQVSYDEEILTVASKQEQKDENKYGKHELKYQVSAPGLDVDSIDATCEKGVLTVKAKEAGDKNKVQIEVK